MLPSPAPHRRGTTSALLLSAALLLLGGLALVMGGTVRWLGCLTPDLWAVACPMHDDAFDEVPGIDLPVAAGYALVGAAALPATLGLRPGPGARGRWALPALGLLTLLVHVAFAVGTLEPGEPGKPGEPASALGQASSLLVLLVPVLSVTGAALVALGQDDTPGRPTARWTGGDLGRRSSRLPPVEPAGTAGDARRRHRATGRRRLGRGGGDPLAGLPRARILHDRVRPRRRGRGPDRGCRGRPGLRAGTVVLAESAFALVLALLGMVLACRAGVSGVHGSRGSQSARSPVASA
ncbi:hypothetical protein [Micrococcus sp.]|uniref:hypothetical protein n=1 Tax=Micrococcus sp. TaxID=1271 RepID=UPI0026DCA45E|nr:hypothetical protein [Micrococcus sp.]MDO4238784.1 hypothetical protein [Micrococcus sp.]